VVTLRQDLAGAAGANAASLETVGTSLVAVHDWTFLFGPGFCAGIGNGIVLGYLMYTSGLMPRYLAVLGLIGGPWPSLRRPRRCSGATIRSPCGRPSR